MSRIYELLFQPLQLWPWQKKMTKYCTELQWANGKEHILSVNQGLSHRIEQKDHELYLLLPSLQPKTLPTAFFLGTRNNVRLNELKAREKNCTSFPKLWLCQFGGAIFRFDRVYFFLNYKAYHEHIQEHHNGVPTNRTFSEYKQCSDSLFGLAGRLCLL